LRFVGERTERWRKDNTGCGWPVCWSVSRLSDDTIVNEKLNSEEKAFSFGWAAEPNEKEMSCRYRDGVSLEVKVV
jgi:hypothetical protein